MLRTPRPINAALCFSKNMNEPEKIAVLLSDFCEAAISKGDHGASTKEDHEMYAKMGAVVKTLRELGPGAMEAFKVLLSHDSKHVRMWVASELLSDGDLDAKAILEQLASSPGLIGLNASLVLDEFSAGQLNSPFGTR